MDINAVEGIVRQCLMALRYVKNTSVLKLHGTNGIPCPGFVTSAFGLPPAPSISKDALLLTCSNSHSDIPTPWLRIIRN
jgi:hypothetical protein